MTSEGPRVSVVLPIYNGAAEVTDAIRSIQEQTWTDWELLILDDGSSDDSVAVCESFAAQDARIRFYRNEKNLGLAKTMNKLVGLARGRYIAVQEHDDISLPDRLALEVEALDAQPEVGLVSGLVAWIDDKGKIFNYFPGMLQRKEQFPQNHAEMVKFTYVNQTRIVNGACMFRRAVLPTILGPFDPNARVSIDWQFFLHVAHRYRIYGLPELLMHVRRGPQHTSVTGNSSLKFREARRCIDIVYHYYKHDPGSPINYSLYRKAMAYQLNIEGRFYGRLRGLGLLLLALAYDPSSEEVRLSLKQLGGRAAGKLSMRRSSSPG